jgi:hypothetical protein
MNSETEIEAGESVCVLTKLVEQIDLAAATAALATDLDLPAETIRALNDAHQLLRIAEKWVERAGVAFCGPPQG